MWYAHGLRGMMLDGDEVPGGGDAREIADDELSPAALARVLEVLGQHGRALTDYRPGPLGRRVLARMRQVGVAELPAYLDLLRRDPSEAERLAAALLVQVTSFFRDPEVFEALQERVLPTLLPRAGSQNRPLRAWVVGTATGQEAYSLAMVLAGLSSRTGVPFDVLGSDLSEAALAHARCARYTEDELESLPLARRRACVEDPTGGFRIHEDVRARVRFEHHDLLGPRLSPRGAIVASFDLVLCRNVLIYLEPRSQALAFDRFADVVVPGGALVLGHAETLPSTCTRFTAFPGVAPRLRIFARTATPPLGDLEGP